MPGLRLCLTAALGLSAPLAAHATPAATAHPAEMMQYAAQVFEQGGRQEAVFWFYLGQLRYRALLTANPGLDPTGDPAVFSALMATLGPPINEWAFGDLDALVATLDQVLAFDRQNPDPSLPTTVVEEIRAGLQGIRAQVIAEADQIRAQRSANGLGNR